MCVLHAYVQNRRRMEEIVHDVSIPSGWALCPRGGGQTPESGV